MIGGKRAELVLGGVLGVGFEREIDLLVGMKMKMGLGSGRAWEELRLMVGIYVERELYA